MTTPEQNEPEPHGPGQMLVDKTEHASIEDAISFANERAAALNWAAEQDGPHKPLLSQMALEVNALKAFAQSKIEEGVELAIQSEEE
jgi:hypothetical protein